MKRGKRNFCKIKENVFKKKKKGKNYEYWANISLLKYTNDASKWKEEKETSGKIKKKPVKKRNKRKTMNIERTFPYLNTQMTLANEKRKKKLLQN